MEITITVSEKICELAKQNGKEVSEFVQQVIEEKLFETKTTEAETDGDVEKAKKRKHNLLKFAGMFSSGKTDTSEKMSELLYEEDFDPKEGFSIKLRRNNSQI